jgi:hypothetical protein
VSWAAGLVLALIAALALNIGFFVQHGAANTLASLTLRHPIDSARSLVTNRNWMLGYAAGWVGWGVYIAALSLAPLSLVQAVSAGGVGVLALLVNRFGTPLEPRERVGAAIAIGGLALLGLSLTAPMKTAPPAQTSTLLVIAGIGVAVAGVLSFVVARTFRPGASLGCAAGILFGVGDLATKGAVSGNGLILVPVLAVCTALGFVALQMAFQRGRVMETAGISSLINNIIPIAGGLFVFHESIPTGWAGVARLASFVAVVTGAVLLAHAPPVPLEGDAATDAVGAPGGSIPT